MATQTGYELSLRDYWRILRKKKGTVILTAVLLAFLSLVLAYLNKPVPLYRSTSSVQIERTVAATGLLLQTISWGQEDNIETQLRVIESLPIMERVAIRLGWVEAEADTSDEHAQAHRITRILGIQGMVSTSQEGFTNIVHITVVDTDSRVAQQVAQTVAEVYKEHHTEYRNRRTLEAKRYIENQRAYWEALLAAVRDRVEDYQEREGIISVEANTNAILSRIAQAEAAYGDARFTRKQISSLIAQLEQQKEAPELASGGLYLESVGPYVQKLSNDLSGLVLAKQELLVTLTAKHPRVVGVEKRIEDTVDAIIRELAGQQRMLDSRLEAYEEQIAAYKLEFTSLAAKGTRLNELLRDVGLKEDIYGLLESKYQEVLIKEAEKIEEVQIVAPALEERRPINPPNLAGTTFVGTVIGLILGLVFAFVLETLDTSIGTIEDVEAYLEVPVLGIIPHVDMTEVKDAIVAETHLSVSDRALARDAQLPTHFLPRSMWAESYRALRTNIQFLNVDRVPQTVLISSALAEEGKTTTLVNLGIAMAQMGKNVLLVDADLRKPRVARLFGLPPEPGFTEAILGNTDWRETVRTITDIMTGDMTMEEAVANPGLEHINVIASGAIPPNPSELLSHPRVAKLIDEFKEEFDVVLFDSAPIIPATDAAVLGSKLEGLVLVYQVGQVARGTLKRAKVQMDNVKTRVFGVVLNELRAEVSPDFQDMGRAYQYKYGYTYGYGREQPLGWMGRTKAAVRKFLGWPAKTTRRKAEEVSEGEEQPPKKGFLAAIFGQRQPRAAEEEGAGEERHSRWRVLLVVLSAMLVAAGILWQTGHLDSLVDILFKSGVPTGEPEVQGGLEQAPQAGEPQGALVEPYDDSAEISRAIDSLLETRAGEPASQLAPIPSAQPSVGVLPGASAQVAERAQAMEAPTAQRLVVGYYIQWGAYRVRANAEAAAALLKERGAEVLIREDEGLYRVQTGPLSEYRDAAVVGERFRQQTGRSYWVVPAGPGKQAPSP